jgi:hypothetical protein
MNGGDVRFDAHGLFRTSFDEMRERAHEVQLGDVTVPIAHREDLLRMKRAAGRPQDIADVRLLESLDDET